MKRILKTVGSVVLLIFIGYILYRNVMLHYIPSVDLIKDESTSNLYNKILPNTNNKEWINYYYSHNKVNQENMPTDLKYNIAYKNIHNSSSIIKEEKLQNTYNSIFGLNTYKTIDKFYGSCNEYKYNSEKKEYVKLLQSDSNCNKSNISIISKIVDAKINNKSAELTVVIAYIDSINKKVYQTCNSNMSKCSNLIKDNYTDFDESNLQEYKNKLHKYKFKYIVNNDDYYFNEVVKIK